MANSVLSAKALCPFFLGNAGKIMTCEIVKFKFPDLNLRDSFTNEYCCKNYGYCTIYKALNEYYEQSQA